MKKPVIIFSFAILFSINLFFTEIAKSQTIIELIIYPSNPTSMDDIILVSENLFTSGGCWIDSSSMIINGYDIQLETFFTSGSLAVMCTSYDTFQLGQLSDGIYQLHYNLRHPSANPQIEDSTTIVFSVGSVGLPDNNTKSSQAIFPNPTEGKIFLKPTNISNDGELLFRVFSIQGKELKCIRLDASKAELQIDLSDLQSGYYLYEYQIRGSNNRSSGKLEIK